MKELLERLGADDAMLVPPPEAEDIEEVQLDLKEGDFPAMPADYIDFLKSTDGFWWNGIEFFGASEVIDEDDDYVLPDIVTANENYAEYKDIAGKLILGRSDEDLFLFDIASGTYQIVDSVDLAAYESFNSFEALFKDVIVSRLDALDDDDDDDVLDDDDDE